MESTSIFGIGRIRVDQPMAEQLPTSGLLQRPLQTGRVGWGTQQVRRLIRLLRVPIGITTAPLACF